MDCVMEVFGNAFSTDSRKVEKGIEETLTYMDFPSQHWSKIRTNNVIERMNRDVGLRIYKDRVY